MNNKQTRFASDYHEETKHSELGLQLSRHSLDWDDRPRPFKVYPDLPSIGLPQDFPIPTAEALPCIRNASPLMLEKVIDIGVLSELLFFSAGITRETKYENGTYYMRAASATGALYPIELYLICQGVSSLASGVYHFCPGDFSLTQLRNGDFRSSLATFAGDNRDILSAPVTVVFTSLAWRNAWKYRARSYRHWFWDSGVIAANFIAVANSAGFRTALVTGFVDHEVNNLLCLDYRKEAAVAIAPIVGRLPTNKTNVDLKRNSGALSVPPLANPKILPISMREVEYPEIWKIHEASNLLTVEEVREWVGSRNTANQRKLGSMESKPFHRQEMQNLETNQKTARLGDVILRRGSTRRFTHFAISKDHLSTILYNSTRGVPLDILREGDSLVDIYLIANAVEGLSSGHHFYNKQTNSLERLQAREEVASRNESGYLCLGQPLFSDASVVFFIMTELNEVFKTYGNRGYRACQLEAGVVAGKIYLSSYALGLGASGSTFYDDAVTEFFSPHARNKATMIAVGIGVPAYKARPGKVLATRLTKSELCAGQ
jgi:SagB-type dehydrogenase family enzyme